MCGLVFETKETTVYSALNYAKFQVKLGSQIFTKLLYLEFIIVWHLFPGGKRPLALEYLELQL